MGIQRMGRANRKEPSTPLKQRQASDRQGGGGGLLGQAYSKCMETSKGLELRILAELSSGINMGPDFGGK